MTTPPSGSRGRLATHPVLAGLALAIVVALVLLAWAATAAVLARNELLAAREQVQSLRDEAADLDLEAAGQGLDRATEASRRARALLRQPAPALAARVPVVGAPLAAQRDVAEAAAAVAESAQVLLSGVREVTVAGGAVDVDAVEALAGDLQIAVDRTREPVARLLQRSTASLPGPVADGVVAAQDALRDLPTALDRAAAAARAASGLLGADGPRSVLVAIMNNAELRGAGGYASSFTVVRTDAGRVAVTPFFDVHDVDDPPGSVVTVAAPPDYERRWGPYLANSTLYKNVLMSPHGPASASVACSVAAVSPGVPCDATVLIDVPALAELITLTGPVVLPDGSQTEGEELVRALLVDVYADVGPTDPSGAQRRQALRAAGDAGLGSLLRQELSGPQALRVLLELVRGRHVQVWSGRAEEQADLVLAGAAGSVDPQGDDLSLVAFNALSASKLDFYVQRDQRVSVEVGQTSAVVTSEVTFTLDRPDDLPSYALGRDGTQSGVLDLGIGPRAVVRSVEVDGEPREPRTVAEDGGLRLPFPLDLDNLVPRTWRVTYETPVVDGTYRLRLLPQPLARDAQLTLDVRAAEGHVLLDPGTHDVDGPHDRIRTVVAQAVRR